MWDAAAAPVAAAAARPTPGATLEMGPVGRKAAGSVNVLLVS